MAVSEIVQSVLLINQHPGMRRVISDLVVSPTYSSLNSHCSVGPVGEAVAEVGKV